MKEVKTFQDLLEIVDEVKTDEITDAFKDLNLGLPEDIIKIFGAILSLPDYQFKTLAPIFSDEIHKSIADPSLIYNVVGQLKKENIDIEGLQEMRSNLQNLLTEEKDLSEYKRLFLFNTFDDIINALMETQLIGNRIINIPYEKINADAKVPTYANIGDAGLDVYALEDYTLAPGEKILVKTGIKVAIPQGYELQVRPKSGISLKSGLRIANAPGTIDSGYRDEIGIIVENIEPILKEFEVDDNGYIYAPLYGSSHFIEKGQKIAQLVLAAVPTANFIETQDISLIGNNRGGGFGSTGLK